MANDIKFENSVHIAGSAGGSPELQEFSSRDAIATRLQSGKCNKQTGRKASWGGEPWKNGGARKVALLWHTGTEYGALAVTAMSRNTTRSTEGKSASNWLIESVAVKTARLT